MSRPVHPLGAAIVLAAALSAMACASGASGDHGGEGGTGGGDGGPPRCQVKIVTITQPVDGGFTGGPGVTLRVQGEVTGTPAPSYGWQWNVTFADGSSVPITQVEANDPQLIDFPLARPGTYSIQVALTGSALCSGQQTIVVPAPGARLASFRFHFVPPPTSMPPQDQTVQVLGGTPFRGTALSLSAGTIVRFDPRDQTGAVAVPSYVRITDEVSGQVVLEARTPSAGATVDLRLVDGTYDMLVVPSSDVAPILIAGKSPAQLQVAMPLALAPGVAIGGTVTDSAGAPVVGANVALQAGTLPSTLGVTDASGGFTLHASAGTYGATITRPAGQGVLAATLPAAPGLTIVDNHGADAAAPPSLDVRVPAVSNTKVTLKIGATVAASLGAGAKVVVESPAPIPNLATVTFGAVTQSAAVQFRAELSAPADSGDALHSTLVVSGMPAALYHATVFPADAAGVDAITTAAIDLSNGVSPPSPQAIPLGAKVTLGGTLLPVDETSGVGVTALDVVGDFPIAIAGLSIPGGGFSLPVSPQRTYLLRAEPAAGQLLARTLFGPVTVNASAVTLAAQPMSSALFYANTVVDDQLEGIDGALVQVFCVAGAAGCADPQTPLAETVTLSDGSFQLMLPDPGVDP